MQSDGARISRFSRSSLSTRCLTLATLANEIRAIAKTRVGAEF
jgi:hypothetical protein